MIIFTSPLISCSIIAPYRLAASSKSVPSSISSTPIRISLRPNSLLKATILPAKVEMSFLEFCGSSIMSSNSLKVPMRLRLARIGIGRRYLANSAALRMLFKSIDFPPAFTPVISRILPQNSMLTRFGFLSAGWAKLSRTMSREGSGKTNS